MNILDLDCYSLKAIILKLDIYSYKALLQTCKCFNQIAKNTINIVNWQHEIQKKFVEEISNGVDKNDDLETCYFQYRFEMPLKIILNALKYIEFLSHLETNTVDLADITMKLINKSFPYTIPMELADMAYKEEWNLKNWYSFCVKPDHHISICNVQSVEDNEKLTVIIIHVSNFSRIYCYNERKPENWSSSMDTINRNLYSSGSITVFEPACNELQNLFAGDEELITPSELFKLVSIDLHEEVKRSKVQKCIHDNDENVNENNILSQISKIKKASHNSTVYLLKYLIKHMEFVKYVELFCQIVPHHECIEFIQWLTDASKLFFNTYSLFSYENALMPYLPTIRKLLVYADLKSRISTDDNETISMFLPPDRCLQISVSKVLKKYKIHWTLKIYIERDIDIEWDSVTKFDENLTSKFVQLKDIVDRSVS